MSQQQRQKDKDQYDAHIMFHNFMLRRLFEKQYAYQDAQTFDLIHRHMIKTNTSAYGFIYGAAIVPEDIDWKDVKNLQPLDESLYSDYHQLQALIDATKKETASISVYLKAATQEAQVPEDYYLLYPECIHTHIDTYFYGSTVPPTRSGNSTVDPDTVREIVKRYAKSITKIKRRLFMNIIEINKASRT